MHIVSIRLLNVLVCQDHALDIEHAATAPASNGRRNISSQALSQRRSSSARCARWPAGPAAAAAAARTSRSSTPCRQGGRHPHQRVPVSLPEPQGRLAGVHKLAGPPRPPQTLVVR